MIQLQIEDASIHVERTRTTMFAEWPTDVFRQVLQSNWYSSCGFIIGSIYDEADFRPAPFLCDFCGENIGDIYCVADENIGLKIVIESFNSSHSNKEFTLKLVTNIFQAVNLYILYTCIPLSQLGGKDILLTSTASMHMQQLACYRITLHIG